MRQAYKFMQQSFLDALIFPESLEIISPNSQRYLLTMVLHQTIVNKENAQIDENEISFPFPVIEYAYSSTFLHYVVMWMAMMHIKIS